MSLLRYRAEEARNIAQARREAERTARIEGSIAKRLAGTDAAGLQSRITALTGTVAGKASIASVSTIGTDADETFTAVGSASIIFHTGTLTAARAITLSTSGVLSGYTERFVRTGAGAFDLSIGGLKNLATNTWCDVVYDGSVWVLTASGSL
ncbi:hypothetical protein [Sinorhizobium meliloti]|uniref:hypothetical protein n=1 Tax=Rhizobium meliloti TaxID=382 RepID=UPI000FD94D31|nr:hypothetical protein [Sinorhizobium meliloti]RVH21450.1 hypothetical protein CN216_00315 [Sinorhizobium meliloti]RVH21511.1 hypothetical protein CN216_00635 [Sinorhizobium meliloti]